LKNDNNDMKKKKEKAFASFEWRHESHEQKEVRMKKKKSD